MPTHMPVLVDFWAIGDGRSTGPTTLDDAWSMLTSLYGVDSKDPSFTVNTKYVATGDACSSIFTRVDDEGRITQQTYQNVL